MSALKITIEEIIKQHKELLDERKKEVERLEYLWNIRDVSADYMGNLEEINNKIITFLATELEVKY